MNIGFDISQTGSQKTGCGFLADSLIRNLVEIDTRNQYTLFPTFGNWYWDPKWQGLAFQCDRPNVRYASTFERFEDAASFWGGAAKIDDQIHQPDIVHSNNFFCPANLDRARVIYTLYDLSFLEFPMWTTELNRVGCFTGVFEASIRAAAMIAISKYTRDNFLKRFPHYPADRVKVVYPASRFTDLRPVSCPDRLRHLTGDGFWLSVGTIEPRKNHLKLLSAYARHKTLVGQARPLVLAGGKGWLMDEFARKIADLGLAKDVQCLGYVDDTELQWLYENCHALVYPSLFEGFGLPVLEAMSRGAAVITSRTTSLPEIVGHAGILVDPANEDDIAHAMFRLTQDRGMQERLRVMAREQAGRFSWREAAKSVLDLYSEVAGRRRMAA